MLRSPTCFYLIPIFLVGLQVLQSEALRCQKEKQESNRNKRAAQQLAKRLEKKVTKLRAIELESPGATPDAMDDSDDVTARNCRWDVRGMQRNKGINIEFEVRFTDARHPITAGLPAFKMRDELYHRQELQPGAIVLAEAYSLADPPRNWGTGKWEPALVVLDHRTDCRALR